jgi:hypothetical protein
LTARESSLSATYTVTGQIGAVVFDKPAPAPRFTDNLWQTTCFELFLAHPRTASYYEFNFSPSGHYAYYLFDDYRVLAPLQPPREPAAPCPISITCHASQGSFTLEAHLTSWLFDNLKEKPASDWLVNLTAVIAQKDATNSYFALHHPALKPDFHDKSAFISWPANP